MANLHYEILTDPAPLQVSGTGVGEESEGAVYIVIVILRRSRQR